MQAPLVVKKNILPRLNLFVVLGLSTETQGDKEDGSKKGEEENVWCRSGGRSGERDRVRYVLENENDK
jgi:hypothetical protein